MRRLSAVALSACLCLALTGAAQASITGTPIGDPAHPAWMPASTNAANYASASARPHVLLNSVGPGQVTLDFFAGSAGQSRFEIRIDGAAAGSTSHPVVIGDTIHPGPNVHANGTTYPTTVQNTYSATQYVDVRLALGGERDWDFNWTRFEVGPAVVPEPGTIAIWSGIAAMAGVVAIRRRRNA